MSSKRRTKRNRSGNQVKVHKGSSHPRWKFLPPEEPDVSRISKVAGVNQLEELCDSFDQPLHSTAVDACGEEHSENASSSYGPTPQRTNTESSENMHLKMPEGNVHDFSQSGSNTPNTTQSGVKKKGPSKKSTPDSVNSPLSVELWCPNELKRSSRDITELDVVLAEFEKIAANYRQSIESKTCRKAISAFCSAFKDQVTDLITEVQELKNMKKKNAKVVADINKKRQRLLQVREKLSRTEPQLVKLQKEYAEVEERQSSLRQVVQFLTDLKELQHDYLDSREENPRKKVVYGTSSLPALLMESQRILQAERHFQNINRKLEYALEVQRGKSSKEH
ncbi:centromere protein U isoform X2 [Excalfactoria chinensis]|uniref:centromere protein U isoform X2 n=1 Tax=Excalfactoria chinensis TaxID=46218 RepID=UPI003B3B2006